MRDDKFYNTFDFVHLLVVLSYEVCKQFALDISSYIYMKHGGICQSLCCIYHFGFGFSLEDCLTLMEMSVTQM